MSFFGVGKKRDLSDKSRNGEDAKKIRENSANSLSDLPDEVFEDGLASPDCAKIFFNCLKRIESDVKKLFEIQAESKDAQIKVTESLQNLSDKLDEIEAENKKKDEKITQLEERVKELEKEKKDIYDNIDEMEQYSRRNCLLLHGVRENSNENTDDIVVKTISENLDIDIQKEDLDRTHRVGKGNRADGKARPIIIKFARYNVRRNVYSNKRKLKGKSLLITESLTAARVRLLKQAQTRYGVENVWSSDGRILHKIGNNILQYKGVS